MVKYTARFEGEKAKARFALAARLPGQSVAINVERNQIGLVKDNLKALLNASDRVELVYQRGYLQCIRDNNELMMLCESCRSTNEIDKWNSTVLSERKEKEDFLAQNKELKHWYDKKAEITKASVEKM